jgi:hypothetical protein
MVGTYRLESVTHVMRLSRQPAVRGSLPRTFLRQVITKERVFTARIAGQAARLSRLAACARQASAKTHRGATVHGSVTTPLDHFGFAGVIARKIKLPNQSGSATPSR